MPEYSGLIQASTSSSEGFFMNAEDRHGGPFFLACVASLIITLIVSGVDRANAGSHVGFDP
jgi:hypothetical protein